MVNQYFHQQHKYYYQSLQVRHNIMLLWFVKIYERNLKKLQFTTQRFDTPVYCLNQGSS